MKRPGNRWLVMLGVALLLVAGAAVFAPQMARQSAANPVAGDAEVLANGAPSVKGYADGIIDTQKARLAQNPADYQALAQLGLAYLQKARETNDPTYYTSAEQELQKALALKPGYFDAMAGMGSLELSRHQFSQALDWGTKASKVNPYKAYSYGVIGDAEIELGRYEQAVESFQHMVDLHPDLSSYSRVSYARELYGDIPGAIEAMQQAIEAGSPAAENTAWCRVQLGNLYFNSGQINEAEKEYDNALALYPGYLHAQAGLAQVQAALGNTRDAVDLYKQSVSNVPLPQYLSALGDLYTSIGDTASAKEQYDTVSYIYKIFEANGVNADIEKAAFMADRNESPAEAVALAEKATKERQDVNSQSTLAWTLYRAGRYPDALQAQKNAMRLGTRNALFFFRMGLIYSKLGDAGHARENLRAALDINPHFNPLYAREAANMLAALGK